MFCLTAGQNLMTVASIVSAAAVNTKQYAWDWAQIGKNE